WVPQEPAAGRIRTRRSGIVNRKQLVSGIHPFGEVPAIHFRSRHALYRRVAADPVSEALIRQVEKRPIAAIVELGYVDRSSRSDSEVVLLVHGFLHVEKCARVELLVAQKVVRGSVKSVGSRPG